jgi:hypothetical protein
MVKVERILWLVLFLLSISAVALADEQTSEKPEDWEKQLERLRAVPYVGVSETVADESGTGVLFYNPEKTHDGYNLYCTWSSGQAFLIDMEGQVVHKWTYKPQEEDATKHGVMADHVIMLENGDVVVLRKWRELIRLNWDSELIWKREMEAHHDVAQAPDGSFYVVVREYRDFRDMQVRFALLVHLTADGEEIERWSTHDHLAQIKFVLNTRSFLDTVLDNALASHSGGGAQLDKLKDQVASHFRYDYFHMNTVNVLPANALGARDPRFKKGSLLVCFRNVNQIAVLERDTYRVLWAWGEGEIEGPHHPTMLQNGHILVFDNGLPPRQYSRVLELDPATESIVWEYRAEIPEDFYSQTRGSAQRLPNGNTLICESDKGRAFEVTEEGEIVWEWVNPVTIGGRVETLYRMERLPSTQVEELLSR